MFASMLISLESLTDGLKLTKRISKRRYAELTSFQMTKGSYLMLEIT